MTTYAADMVGTQHVTTDRGTYACRRLGPPGASLVWVLRFRRTIDHGDLALPDVRAAERHAIVFGDAGHGFLFRRAEDFGREVPTFLR